MRKIVRITNIVCKALALAIGVVLFVGNAQLKLNYDLAIQLISIAIICLAFSILSK